MKKEKRLTDNIYGENPIHVEPSRTTAIYEKCYELEDLMEKYDIKDLKELDKIIGQWKAMVEALPYNCKNNKALEIITNKIKIEFTNQFFGIKGNYYIIVNNDVLGAIKVDKEEYDLLKEVLL